MTTKPVTLTCPRPQCLYTWEPRLTATKPKCCPRCKHRLDRPSYSPVLDTGKR